MKTLDIYKFSELNEQAKQKALDWWKENREPNFDADAILEGIKEDLESMGMEEIDVRYSGFWSQGDGLSFTGDVYDTSGFLISVTPWVEKHLNGLSTEVLEQLYDSLQICFERNTSRYVHEKSVDTNLSAEWLTSDTFNIIPKLEVAIDQWRIEKCKEFYDRLSNYYDECSSDESVKMYLEEQERELWSEDGTFLKFS